MLENTDPWNRKVNNLLIAANIFWKKMGGGLVGVTPAREARRGKLRFLRCRKGIPLWKQPGAQSAPGRIQQIWFTFEPKS